MALCVTRHLCSESSRGRLSPLLRACFMHRSRPCLRPLRIAKTATERDQAGRSHLGVVAMVRKSTSERDIDSYLPKVPLLSAAETARLLGYSSTGALAKARQTGRLPIEMFQMPGRRGWFAATAVVRAWLQEIMSSGSSTDQGGAP